MSKLNSVFIAKANVYKGSKEKPATLEKETGLEPIILNVLGGKAPNSRILSGTVALNEGFEPGKAYVVSCAEGDFDPEYGRRFRFTNAGELDTMTTIELLTSNKMGAPDIVDVTSEFKKSKATAKREI